MVVWGKHFVEKIENLIPMVVFARVVERLSFTEAAKSLGMSKSSVSRDIAMLEERIGGMLLKRTTRKIEVTELGLSYYQHCAKIASELRSSEQFIKEYYQEPAGTITILAPLNFGSQYVIPALDAFLKKTSMPISISICPIKRSIFALFGCKFTLKPLFI